MPVIINELEVIAPPPSPEKVSEASAQPRPQLGPRPIDVYRVMEKFMRRRHRLHAR